MIRAIIVEDVKREREHIEKILAENFNDIHLTASCSSYAEAAATLENQKPQLLLFDIELDGGKLSFDLLNNFETDRSEFIFITAYRHYALQAIEMSCCGYVLKPYHDATLIRAIEKARLLIHRSDGFNRIELLLQNLKAKEPGQKIIALQNATQLCKHEVIPVNNILYVVSQKDHTSLIVAQANTADKKIFHSILSKGIGDIAGQFADNTQFIRVHSQYLLNTAFITGYRKADSFLMMFDGTEIPVARERKQAVLKLLYFK